MMDIDTIRKFREKLRRVERELGWSQRNDIQCCGVTMAQCHTLIAMGGRDETSIVELAGILGVDTSTLSRNIDTMVKNGLINRALNPQDRRYVSLSLTEEGKRALDSIDHLAGSYVMRMFEFIPEEKQGQVMESLDLIAAALERCGEKYRCCGETECCGGTRGDDNDVRE